MPSSALYTHFQALFASQQSSLALEQLHKLANGIPSDETRGQVQHLLQSQPPHWESAITLLEQALALLKEEQKSNVLLVIGDENYSFQNIIGSIININKIERKPLPHHLTPIPGINLATDCIGRETELTQLHQLLHSSPKVALIRGLGGIGKTTLAQAYLSLHLQDYQHLAWITQGDDLIQSIALDASLAESLDKPFQAGEDLPTRFIQLLQALRAIPGPNLLVIDNATQQVASPEVFQYLPSAPHWKVLVTSRQDLPDFVPLELQVLQPAAALQLFRLHHVQGKDAEVMDLLHEIGYHTLTTELMAKTLERQSGLLSVAGLLASLRNRSLDDPDLEEKLSARHSGVAEQGLFQYLMRLYNVAALGEKEIWVLQQLAVLPAIPLLPALLAEWLEPVLNAAKEKRRFNFFFWIKKKKKPQPSIHSAHELTQILNGLVDQGWLSKQEEGFVVHRLIQELIKYKQAPGLEELAALIEAMSGKMSLGAYGNPVTDNFPWLPYAEKVAEYFKDEELLPERVSVLWNNLGLRYSDLGDYRRAAELLELALASNLRNFGAEHPTVAVSQSNLAIVLRELGEYGRAAELLELSLASDLRNFGKDHPRVAVSQSNLANVLSDLGEYGRAAELLELSLASDLRNFGADHPSVARSQSNLALALRDLGEYGRAAELLELSLASDLRNFGEDHPTVTIKQCNLALALSDLGEYGRAAELLDLSLGSDLRNFGADHPEVAKKQSNLALVLSDLGEYGRASQLLELSLASDLRNFGEGHPRVAMSQSNLANVLSGLGEYGRAAELLELSLASDLRNFGADHPNVAVRRSNLANVLSDLGEYGRASQLLELSLASYLRNFGEGHPRVAMGQSNLALVLRDLGEYGRAAELLELSLASYLRNFGADHPTVAIRHSNLALVLSDLGEYGRASQLLEHALASDLRNFGADHPSVARSQSNLANVLRALGDHGRAAGLLEHALASDLRNFGEDHPNVANHQSNLAMVYSDLQNHQAALNLLQQALASFERLLGPEHPYTKKAAQNLQGVREAIQNQQP